MRPLREASETGSADEGRIEWTTRVAVFTPTGVSPIEAGRDVPTRLYRVTAEVTFPSPAGGQRKYTLADDAPRPAGDPSAAGPFPGKRLQRAGSRRA